MVFDAFIWVFTVFLVLPQVIVCAGWLIYLFSPNASQINGCSTVLTDLDKVDVVIPYRDEEHIPFALINDLQPVREKGAQIVLLESCNSIPNSLADSCLYRKPFKTDKEWQLSEREWGLHCWGPPPPGYKAGVLNLWLQNTDSEIIVVIDADWRVAVNDVLVLVSGLRCKI